MTCPICGKPVASDYRPFCSRRCADVDLGRWLTESYRIPATGEEDAEDTPPDDPAPKAH
ncbi:MAG: DNA gyrase inhibitor YacG [Rhodobacterales bacterium]|nr:DNA gyrase inhibitor YacG [Rhodobacterales bacterium]